MTVFHFPGNLRIGVRNEAVSGVEAPGQTIAEEKLSLFVLLNGHQRFRLGGREYLLSTVMRSDPGPKALLLRIGAGQWLEYLESTGQPLVKISISTGPDWLVAAGALVEEVMPGNTRVEEVAGIPAGLLSQMWAPDADMLATARDIVAIHQEGRSGLRSRSAMNLALMSRGIDLFRAALASLGTLRQDEVADTAAAGDPRLATLAGYIASHLDDPGLGPEELARACGLGLRSLQRLLRRSLDCSPREFIRAQRMEAAFVALCRGRVNVQQAAFMAGYSSAANFSTAFKRAFGVTPGQAQEQR